MTDNGAVGSRCCGDKDSADAVVTVGAATTMLYGGRQDSHPPAPYSSVVSDRAIVPGAGSVPTVQYADEFGLRFRCRATVPRAGSACPAPPQQRLLALPLEWPSRAAIGKGCRTDLLQRRLTEFEEREIAVNNRGTFDEGFYCLLMLLMEDKGDVCVAFRNGEL